MPRRKYWKKSEARRSAVSTDVPDVGVLPSVSSAVIELSDGGLAIPNNPSVSLNCHKFAMEHCQEYPSTLQTNLENNHVDDCIQPSLSECADDNDLNTQTTECGQSFSQFEFIATPLCNETFNVHSFAHSTSRPYNSEAFILGSFNQGSSLFSENSLGSQCTINALCSLLHAKYSDLNTQQSLDDVLLDGDALYNKTIFDLKAQGALKSRLLNFDELPNTVSLLNKEIVIKKGDTISGVCTQQFASMHLPSLYQSLHNAFQMSSYILFMIGSVCSALFKKDDEYYIFDSHSHGPDGLSAPDGKSLLASFSCLEDLVTFMYAVYDSMMIDLTAQFDMLPLDLTERGFAPKTMHLICTADKLKRTCKKGLPEESDWLTVSYKQQNKIQGHVRNTLTCSKVKNEKTEQQKAYDIFPKDQHCDTLIGQYFKDQKRRNDCKQDKCKKRIVQEDSRTIYQRLYKRKARQSDEFRQKERDSKRTIRESVENKKKEQALNLASMRKARQSDEFRRKERDAKRRRSESVENKEKDKAVILASMMKARQSEEYRQKERDSKRTRRESIEYKEKDQAVNLASMRKARQSYECQQKERDSKRLRRESVENKEKDKAVNLASMTKARQSEEFRQKERDSKRLRRQSVENKEKDKAVNLTSMRKARQSEEFRQKERDSNRTRRESMENKEKDQAVNLVSMRKARQSDECRQKERDSKRINGKQDKRPSCKLGINEKSQAI